LQLGQNGRHLVGIGAAGCFGTQLGLDELIELAVDAENTDACAEIAGRRPNLNAALGNVTGRLRVGDIRRNDRERRLVCTQPGHRSGES